MPHVRQQIRAAVVAALTNATDAGAKVYPSRVRDIGAEKLPTIGVATTDEASALATYDPDDGGKRYNRTVNIELDLYARGGDADDQVDQLAVDAETAMERDDTFGGLVRNLVLVSSRDVYSAEGENIAGRKRLTYQATYKTKAGRAEAAI